MLFPFVITTDPPTPVSHKDILDFPMPFSETQACDNVVAEVFLLDRSEMDLKDGSISNSEKAAFNVVSLSVSVNEMQLELAAKSDIDKQDVSMSVVEIDDRPTPTSDEIDRHEVLMPTSAVLIEDEPTPISDSDNQQVPMPIFVVEIFDDPMPMSELEKLDFLLQESFAVKLSI
jgi:hypothetical protein